MPALLITMSSGPAASSAFATDSADCTSSSIDFAAILRSFEVRLQGFQAIGAPRRQHDGCTGLAEATGEMRAQSRRGTGDQGCLAAKVEWLWVSHFIVSQRLEGAIIQ